MYVSHDRAKGITPILLMGLNPFCHDIEDINNQFIYLYNYRNNNNDNNNFCFNIFTFSGSNVNVDHISTLYFICYMVIYIFTEIAHIIKQYSCYSVKYVS